MLLLIPRLSKILLGESCFYLINSFSQFSRNIAFIKKVVDRLQQRGLLIRGIRQPGLLMLDRLHLHLLAAMVWLGCHARLQRSGRVNLFFLIIMVDIMITGRIFVTNFAAACRPSIIAIF